MNAPASGRRALRCSDGREHIPIEGTEALTLIEAHSPGVALVHPAGVVHQSDDQRRHLTTSPPGPILSVWNCACEGPSLTRRPDGTIRAMSKERVETLSDGVFAIAITLLVLTIAQPDHYNDLGQQLADRWPAFAAYVVSFAVIGIMWFNHHSIFAHFERVDRGFVYLNLLLLMTIAFIPYPTGILGQALRQGAGAQMAAVVYSIVMAVNAYSWSALWIYASRGRRLLTPSFPEAQRGVATLLFTIGCVLYTLTIGIAFISAYACLAVHGLLAIYYALDPLSRRAARTPRGTTAG